MSLLANLCTGQKFPAYQLCKLELAQLLLWTSMLAAWAVLKKHLQLALETFSHALANLAAKLKFLQAFSAWDLCTQRSWDWNYAFQIFTVSDENLQSLDWFLQASAKKNCTQRSWDWNYTFSDLHSFWLKSSKLKTDLISISYYVQD
jgi:hypothetical protein